MVVRRFESRGVHAVIYAIQRHDIPLMQAIILIITLVFTSVNLIADLLYAFFNPRIRYGQTSS